MNACLLALHNVLTLALQSWNDELATIAQDYANRCIWGHNPSRNSESFLYVGENIYVTTGTVSDYRSVVQTWYDEVADYHYSSNTCDPGKACEHYTQVSRGARWATRCTECEVYVRTRIPKGTNNSACICTVLCEHEL